MDLDTALYIKINGRGWAIWLNQSDELMAIPEDEEPFNDRDLQKVQQYLLLEGFFSKHFKRQMI